MYHENQKQSVLRHIGIAKEHRTRDQHRLQDRSPAKRSHAPITNDNEHRGPGCLKSISRSAPKPLGSCTPAIPASAATQKRNTTCEPAITVTPTPQPSRGSLRAHAQPSANPRLRDQEPQAPSATKGVSPPAPIVISAPGSPIMRITPVSRAARGPHHILGPSMHHVIKDPE